jgi:anion-transporting  ArsA/GET3 family ATPase
VKPKLSVKAIVCLTGDSESGKTTLACAWAREASRNGHGVVILERDKSAHGRPIWDPEPNAAAQGALRRLFDSPLL